MKDETLGHFDPRPWHRDPRLSNGRVGRPERHEVVTASGLVMAAFVIGAC